ncbi:MAG: hypothetical protein J1F02_12000 [Lachnospiraceae bacterium]|nr:hypothetical protein [Lachnospiraceae bacterium]
MALINCPECNKEISDTVKVCPGCGYKFKKSKQKKEKKEPKIFKSKKSKRIAIVILAVVIAALLGIGGFWGYKYYLVPLQDYKVAESLASENKFDEAIAAFEALDDFKDSKDKVLETHYKKAEYLLESKSYVDAVKEFELAGDYSDSKDRVNETMYQWAEASDVEESIRIYEELGDYKDSADKLASAKKKKEADDALKKMETAYDSCESSRTKLSSDKKSIIVDSSSQYDYISSIDIVTIISALGLPSSLFDEMCATNALMGRQTETYDYYEVSWSYHPDNGLDVIFKYKN